MANSQSHNPYVGPRPFEREERNLFFGREREISELQSLLTAHRTLLLYAASGAGKSSLLNAGLLPLMEQEGFEVFPVARVRGLLPEGIRSQDISNLYVFNTLMRWKEDEAAHQNLPRMSLAEFLKTREHILDSEGFFAPRLIIFDQFEELFTLYQQHWKQRADFFQQVADALEEDPLLRVLFVMREDYLASFDPYISVLPELLRARYRLDRLRFEVARQAVEGPLKGSSRSFAKGVAAHLVGELLKTKVQSDTGTTEEAVGEYVEPVQLQIVCRNLWAGLPADVTVITSEHLRSFGDVDEALKGFYEYTLQKTIAETTVKEKELRKWFARQLITPAGTRGTVYRGKEDTAGIPNAAVDILENEHILRGEMRAGAHWYELTHDRLIEPVRRSNETWIPDFEVEQARLRVRKKIRKYLNIVVPVILVLTVFSLWQWQEAERALKEAERAQKEAKNESNRAFQLSNQLRSALSPGGTDLKPSSKEVLNAVTDSIKGTCLKIPEEALDASFDPQTKNLKLTDEPKFNPRKQITLEAWFKTDKLGERQSIITKLHPEYQRREPYYQYHLELRQTGQLYFALTIDGRRQVIDNAFLVDPNKWYHVAATYNGESMQLYLCGKKWPRPTYPTYPKKGDPLRDYGMPLLIGGGGTVGPFKGSLAEVRIWNVALTGDQIRADMDKIIPPDEEGLVWSSTTPLYSYFNGTSTEGWSTTDNSVSNPGKGGNTGGANDGFLKAIPKGDNKTSYYVAPSKYHGDWSSYSELRFDIWRSGGDYYTRGYGYYGDIKIASGQMSASRSLPPPTWEWRTYIIKLQDDGKWNFKGFEKGSKESIDEILKNVTDFQVRAEYGYGKDESGLDNIKLFLK